jgi:anti-sigma factor ChrR (cupin superfamily)
LLEATTPVAPPAPLRARVLGCVHAAATTGVMSRAAAGAWKSVLPGVEVKTLFHDESQRCVSFLLRAQPGASLPAHRHRAYEECLVLQGEFTMGERTLRAGDFELGRPGEDHPVATTQTGVLVYLRGAAEDYPFACP